MHARYPLVAGMLNVHISSHNHATTISLILMIEGAWVLTRTLATGRIADGVVDYALVVLGSVPIVGLMLARLSDADLLPVACCHTLRLQPSPAGRMCRAERKTMFVRLHTCRRA
jgi:hypothetical protein